MLSQATLARFHYTTDTLPLQVARTATPGWLLAIGIANIGTTKLSDCSAMFRPALVMLREVSYSSFSWVQTTTIGNTWQGGSPQL